ncbi:hypothetical protein AB0N65_02075, partial [Paenarthrobacter sp. NPDC089322]
MGVVAQSPAQGRASSGAVPGRFAAVPQGFGVKGTTPVPGSRGSGPAAGVTAGPEVWSVEELPVGSPATVTEALARQGEALAGRELADAALVEPPLAVEGLAELLQDGVSALNEARESAAGQARGFDFLEAANFAGTVEEISRTVEYLQIIAAHAVERTRNEARHAQRATTAGTSWRTGRTETHTAAPSTTEDTANGVLAAAGAIPGAAGPAGGVPASGAVPSGGVLAGGAGAGATAVPLTADTAAVLDDGYRNAAEFLRA